MEYITMVCTWGATAWLRARPTMVPALRMGFVPKSEPLKDLPAKLPQAFGLWTCLHTRSQPWGFEARSNVVFLMGRGDIDRPGTSCRMCWLAWR